MAAQRLFEPPQRPRPTVAERSAGQVTLLEPRGRLLRGTAFALGLAVVGVLGSARPRDLAAALATFARRARSRRFSE